MIITVKKNNGDIKINSKNIEYIVKEQLKMIPGIACLGQGSLFGYLKSLTRISDIKPVRVYPVAEGVIGIVCHIKVVKDANFTEISKGAQHVVKYSVEKKYGLKVDHVDVIIEGVI